MYSRTILNVNEGHSFTLFLVRNSNSPLEYWDISVVFFCFYLFVQVKELLKYSAYPSSKLFYSQEKVYNFHLKKFDPR